jgi:hypothetical protein
MARAGHEGEVAWAPTYVADELALTRQAVRSQAATLRRAEAVAAADDKEHDRLTQVAVYASDM